MKNLCIIIYLTPTFFHVTLNFHSKSGLIKTFFLFSFHHHSHQSLLIYENVLKTRISIWIFRRNNLKRQLYPLFTEIKSPFLFNKKPVPILEQVISIQNTNKIWYYPLVVPSWSVQSQPSQPEYFTPLFENILLNYRPLVFWMDVQHLWPLAIL